MTPYLEKMYTIISSNRTISVWGLWQQSPFALFDFHLRLIHGKISLCPLHPTYPYFLKVSCCGLGQSSLIHSSNKHPHAGPRDYREIKSDVSRGSAPRELPGWLWRQHINHFNSVCLGLKRGWHRKLGTQEIVSRFISRLRSINNPGGDGRRPPGGDIFVNGNGVTLERWFFLAAATMKLPCRKAWAPSLLCEFPFKFRGSSQTFIPLGTWITMVFWATVSIRSCDISFPCYLPNSHKYPISQMRKKWDWKKGRHLPSLG